MDKKSSASASARATTPRAAAAAADAQAKSPEEKAAAEQAVARLQRVCGECLRFATAAFVGYSLAAAAWRARHDPPDLAFVVGAFLLLAALLACLRRAERLAPDSPAGERRRLHAAVWFLSTLLSCAFAYRVAEVMPPAMALLVWCMTAFVVLTGFCLLVLCKDQQYQSIEDADDAGDTNAYAKISPSEELV